MAKGISIYNSSTFIKDLNEIIKGTVGIEKIKEKSIIVFGAGGMIGSTIIDTLMLYAKNTKSNIRVCAVGRNLQHMTERFEASPFGQIEYIEHNIINRIDDIANTFDYIVNAAANSYPKAFNEHPIDTIMGSVAGTNNILDFASRKESSRVLQISSGEVYSDIDGVNVRSCYPNGKKVAESLCAAYSKEKGVDFVVARVCHTFGANTSENDNRAATQFLENAFRNENIILKSKGDQVRSYNYIADTISGVLTILFEGKGMESYDVCSEGNDISIAELAQKISAVAGQKVIYDYVTPIGEQTPIKVQKLNPDKLKGLGWESAFSIQRGIENAIKIKQEIC